MFTRAIIALVISAIMAASSMPVWADEAVKLAVHQEREAFAKDFAATVITILHDPKTPYGDRKNILRRAFSESVDINWIAKFVLGRSWRDATDKQREDYLALYRKFLTETYVTNFAENPSKSIYTIKIMGVNDEDNNEFIVHSQIMLMNQVNLKVDYRVSDNAGTYKVLDIVIENVSLINSHRAEFTALAAQQGVDGVIKKLNELTSAGKPEMSLSMQVTGSAQLN